MPTTGTTAASFNWRAPFELLASTTAKLVPLSLLLLVQRLGIAAVFFMSGRTKIAEGSWLTIDDGAFELFRTDYALPLIPAVPATYAATTAEHLFPILLVLGLFTRFAALGILCMTAIIQLTVPDGWANFHLPWASMALALLTFGAGRIALDALIFRKP